MPDRPSSSALASVQGRCPACGATSLFLGEGGYVTCSRAECPNPTAADELLHLAGAHGPNAHRPAPATCGLATPGIGATPLGPCIREPHDDQVHKDANGARWWPVDGGAQARVTVGAVPREQLHDAIRTLGRLDPAWWRDELRRYAIAQGATARGFLR